LHNNVAQVGLKSDGTTGQTRAHLAARGSASRYMATELTYYMLYSYVTVYLVVDKVQLYVKNVMTNHITTR